MENKQDLKSAWWQPGLQLFFRLSSWIAGPIIVAVFVGKFLDQKFHTTPWLFLLSVGISFVISMIAMIKIGFKEFKRLEEESKKQNSKSK